MTVASKFSLAQFSISKSKLLVSGLIVLGLGLGMVSTPAMANEDGLKRGRETGLLLPRFVSLKAKSVNLRVGPGRKYAITWHYKKRGLPVEVIQEFDQWRRIRDSDGSTGWVLHSLLSSRRTAVVAPWEKPEIKLGKPAQVVLFDGKNNAHKDAATVARLQAGLIVNVEECQKNWCSLKVQGTEFWLKQDALWGVYPGEAVEG
ncbi:MAG: SH3 domain-containing protein [Rhizobiaceae bacterium]